MKLACLACGAVNRLSAERAGHGPKCGVCGATLADGSVAEIGLATLDRALAHDGLPLVIDFWAAWCGPCRMMAPEFAKAAAAMRGRARFAKIDTEAHPEAGARFGIRGIPLLIAFANGREAARQAGAQPAAAIRSWAEGVAAAAPT